jgi:hypothetical protein
MMASTSSLAPAFVTGGGKAVGHVHWGSVDARYERLFEKPHGGARDYIERKGNHASCDQVRRKVLLGRLMISPAGASPIAKAAGSGSRASA